MYLADDVALLAMHCLLIGCDCATERLVSASVRWTCGGETFLDDCENEYAMPLVHHDNRSGKTIVRREVFCDWRIKNCFYRFYKSIELQVVDLQVVYTYRMLFKFNQVFVHLLYISKIT